MARVRETGIGAIAPPYERPNGARPCCPRVTLDGLTLQAREYPEGSPAPGIGCPTSGWGLGSCS
jgi:hypothetical protein